MPSIEQRGPRSWRLIVENGYKPGGTARNQEKKTIRVDDEKILNSEKKLEEHLNYELAKFRMEVESGKYIKPSKISFSDFTFQVWKENYANQFIGRYTRKNYLSIIKSQLIPAFGHMSLTSIKTMHIVKFMSNLRTPAGRKDGKEKDLATNTLLNIYTVLKSILDAAVQWGFIQESPLTGVDRPKASKNEQREMKIRKKAYTSDEARQVMLVLSDHHIKWRLYFIGVILGGFRRGEMLAVEWNNVDLDVGGIFIEKQITHDESGKAVEGEVKTVESEGFVPMPRFYMNELLKYKELWFKEKDEQVKDNLWKGEDKLYLFHSGFGEKLNPNSATQNWRRFISKHNLPKLRLHDLRHTTAMLLREDDVDIKSIQERLRHARLETTLNIYTHKSQVVSRNIADRLEKFNPHPL